MNPQPQTLNPQTWGFRLNPCPGISPHNSQSFCLAKGNIIFLKCAYLGFQSQEWKGSSDWSRKTNKDITSSQVITSNLIFFLLHVYKYETHKDSTCNNLGVATQFLMLHVSLATLHQIMSTEKD